MKLTLTPRLRVHRPQHGHGSCWCNTGVHHPTRLPHTNQAFRHALGTYSTAELPASTLFRRIGVLPATSRSTTTTMPTKVYVACVREGGREATVTRAPHMSQRSTSVVVVPSGFLLRCLRKDMVISLVFEVWIMVPQGPSTSLPYTGGGGGGEPGGQFWSFTECHQDRSW